MPTRPPVHRPRPYDPVQARKDQLAALDAKRGTSTKRGYDADWRRLRQQVLAEEPHCQFCREQGRITGARDIDHIIPVREKPDLRLVRSNLRALCRPCHSARTARGNIDPKLMRPVKR